MKLILGIDEVGRGPWAGPLTVGAVVLPKDSAGDYPAWAADLTDSKKLSPKKREKLAAIIKQEAPASALGWISSAELDELGLSASLRLATRRAVQQIQEQKTPFTEIIIDGTVNFLKNTPLETYVTTLPKADFLIKEVSAASILAKVARDAYMKRLAEKYPGYGFENHVGYGTAAHKQALALLGPCLEHRFSFRPVAVASSGMTEPSARRKPHQTTKQLGDHAESIVADYLQRHGHKILERNHKTKFYEIDIVSVKDQTIFFTEVKYRKSQFRGTALEVITLEKRKQMSFATEAYLKLHPDLKQNYSPLLAAASVSGPDFNLDTWFPINQ